MNIFFKYQMIIYYKLGNNNFSNNNQMVKYFDSRFYAKATEHELINQIMSDPDPLLALEHQLKNEKTILLEVTNAGYIEKLRDFIETRFAMLCEELKLRTMEGKKTTGSQNELLRILKVQQKLNLNGHYLSLSIGPLYQKVLVWSSKMELTGKIIRQLSEFSFNKSLKLFYYYFKYYMSHLNIFFPDQIKIKNVFNYQPQLKFSFKNAKQEFLVLIPDLPFYASSRSLPNFYLIAKTINSQFGLGLEEDDYIFHALLCKIRIVLEQDRNQVVRTVISAYRIFSYIDIAWLRSDDNFNRIPDIFSLPPDYAQIFKECLEIFLIPEAQPKTHDCILDFIESLITLAEKVRNRDIYISLNENAQSILGLLSIVRNFLVYGEQNREGKLNIESVRNQDVMKKLLKIIYNQIAEASEITGIAEEIVQIIFLQKGYFTYNPEIIQICGAILVIITSDQHALLEIIFSKIEEYKSAARPYIITLNLFVQSKYTHQRRDIGQIARAVAESNIFHTINSLVQEEKQNKINEKSITMTVINLYSNICSENPALINILSLNPALDNLFKTLENAENIPTNMDSISDIINFYHHVSLKEGQNRMKATKISFKVFLTKLLTSDRFSQIITMKSFNHFWTTLNRYRSNIHEADKSIFIGLINGLVEISKTYQGIKSSTEAEERQNIQKYCSEDAKLALILRILEKVRESFLNTLSKKALLFLVKSLTNKQIFTSSLLQLPSQSRLLVSLAVQCIKRLLDDDHQINQNQIEESEGEVENEAFEQMEKSENPQMKESLEKKKMDYKKYINEIIVANYELIQKEMKCLIPKLKQALPLYKKQRCTRFVYEIYLEEREINQEIQAEICISTTIAKIQRYFNYLSKTTFREKYKEFDFSAQIIECLTFFPHFQSFLSKTSTENMIKSIPTLVNVTVDRKIIQERNQNPKVLFQDPIGQGIHSKLQQKWTFFHNMVENLSKMIQIQLGEKGEEFGKPVITEVIVPYINKFYDQILFIGEKDELELLDYQRMRYGMKIILELFCISNQNDEKVSKPFNLMFAFYLYYMQKKDSLQITNILSSILNIIRKSKIDLNSQLEDTNENRITVLKRILILMIKTRIKNFISSVYQIRGTVDGLKIEEKKGEYEKQKSIAYYVYLNFRQSLYSFIKQITTQSSFPHSIQIDDIQSTLFESLSHLYEMQDDSKDSIAYNFSFVFQGSLQNTLPFHKYLYQVEKLNNNYYEWLVDNFGNDLASQNLRILATSCLKLDEKFSMKEVLPKYKRKQIIKIQFQDLSAEILKTSQELFDDYWMEWPGIKKKKYSINYNQVNIRKCIKKLLNFGHYLLWLIDFLKSQKWYEHGYCLLTSVHLRQFIKLCSQIIGHFEEMREEDKFEIEAEKLVSVVVELIQEYEDYHVSKKMDKKEKQMKKRGERKQKRQKKDRKKKGKKDEKKEVKEQVVEELENKGKKLEIVEEKKNEKKKKEKKNTLSKAIESFLINVFCTSETEPYLTCKTLQIIMKFINKYMKVKMFDEKNSKSLFQINEGEIVGYLLRVRICEIKHEGFLHLLAQFGVNLIDKVELNVDLELAIKRYFYEKNKSHVSIKSFQKFLSNLSEPELNTFSYLLKIKETKTGEVVDFNEQNFYKYSTYNNAVILLADGVTFDIINYKNGQLKKRKISHQISEEEIKTIDYVPDSLMESFIQNLISNLIRILIREMNDTKMDGSMKEEKRKIKTDVFNLTTILQTLQILVRQSPSLGPYVAKYKCRKLINMHIENSQKETLEMLNSLGCLENKKEIRFITFLVRVMSPLFFNRIFCLVFELCLDSTVLDKSEKGEKIKNYLPYGHSIRQKVIQQLENQLKESENMERKLLHLNLLTMLLSIKEFSRQCLDNQHLLDILHDLFIRQHLKIKERKIAEMSLICKRIIIPFFLNPISLLHQINISLQLDKKRSQKTPNIRLLLNNESIQEQLISNDYFHHTKFKQDWPFTGIVQPHDDDERIDTNSSEDSSNSGSNPDIDEEIQEQIAHEIQLDSDLLRNQQINESSSASSQQNLRQENEMEEDLGDENSSEENEIAEIQFEEELLQNDEGQDSSEDMDDESDDELELELMDRRNEFHLRRPGYESLYEEFDEIISFQRNDTQNNIYKVEKEQENTMRIVVGLISSVQQLQIEENQPLLQLLTSTDLLHFGQKIQFNHFYKYETFFWNHPDLQRIHTFSDVARERRDVMGFDFFGPSRGRRHGRILESAPLFRLPQEDVVIEEENEEGNQIQINEVNEIENEIIENERQNENEELEDPMIREDIREILRRANFSIEDFQNFPRDVQADILENILNERNEPDNLINLQNIFDNEQILNEEEMIPNQPNFQLQHDSQNSQSSISSNPSSQSSQSSSSNQNHPPQNSLQEGSNGENLSQNGQQNRQQNEEGNGQRRVQEEQASIQVPENYRKLSFDHTKKMEKDIISLLNKNGQNNSKFYECSDQFIAALIELLYLMNQNDHINYPFNLLAGLCINSQNETKILSTLIGILRLGPKYTSSHEDLLPKTTFSPSPNQIISNYQTIGYSFISLKILHILSHLSKSYSLSISMLKAHSCPIKQLDLKEEDYGDKTLVQLLISLLEYGQINKQGVNLYFLLNTLHHSTQNYYSYVASKLVRRQRKEEESRQKKCSIMLSEKENQLLCSLLESDFLKENSDKISKIIMRLSLEKENLNSFIKFLKSIIKGLALKCYHGLDEILKSQKTQIFVKKNDIRKQLTVEEPKIVILLHIFYEIMRSLTSTHQKHEEIISEFKQILFCDEIKQFCKRGCEIIAQQYIHLQYAQKIHEFIDCFFIILKIVMSESEKKGDEDKKGSEQIKIASLGEVNMSLQLQKKGFKFKKLKFDCDPIDLEQLWYKKMCTPQGKTFINANIKNKLQHQLKRSEKHIESWLDIPIIAVAVETPHMLDFQNKKSLFRAQIKRIKQKKYYNQIHLYLQRRDVFQQSYTEIIHRKAEELKGKLKIQFEDEDGEDAGGLTRQWFQILSKEMFNPGYALFKSSSTGNTYQPDSKSYINPEHLSFFKFIGRVMGKALHDGYMLDAYFTPAFYKHILSEPITYEDMEEEDYEFYKSLKWILGSSPIEDYVELHFTYDFDNFGEMQVKELIQGGEKIQVTQENKLKYVQLICYAKMATAVQKQLESFLEGFHDLIPPRLIKLFDSKELQIMISGLPTIDIQNLKSNTELVNYNKTDQIIIWLFEVLESFDMELRTAFLQFVTGTSRVPSEGFVALQGYNGLQKFNVHRDFNTEHLPRAHTCFNQLDLPAYEQKDILIEKLTLAITEAKEGFGML